MVSIIAAVADGGVIGVGGVGGSGCSGGAGGAMPWHIAEDLAMFRRTTMGHPVVMGRRTFEAIGASLAGRTNVVVTRNPDFSAEGTLRASSLEQALAMFGPREEVFVIGGGEIYAAAMPLAARLYLTRVHAKYDGDVRFPAWNASEWRLTSREYHPRGEAFEHPFEFLIYDRKKTSGDLDCACL